MIPTPQTQNLRLQSASAFHRRIMKSAILSEHLSGNRRATSAHPQELKNYV